MQIMRYIYCVAMYSLCCIRTSSFASSSSLSFQLTFNYSPHIEPVTLAGLSSTPINAQCLRQLLRHSLPRLCKDLIDALKLRQNFDVKWAFPIRITTMLVRIQAVATRPLWIVFLVKERREGCLRRVHFCCCCYHQPATVRCLRQRLRLLTRRRYSR